MCIVCVWVCLLVVFVSLYWRYPLTYTSHSHSHLSHTHIHTRAQQSKTHSHNSARPNLILVLEFYRYCVVQFKDRSERTHVVKKSLNPEWNWNYVIDVCVCVCVYACVYVCVYM